MPVTIGNDAKSIYKALERCIELRQAIVDTPPTRAMGLMQASRASSRSVQSAARKAANSAGSTINHIYVAHSGALGGLANNHSFLDDVLASRARCVMLPDYNRGGRLAEPAFRLLMNLIGIGVLYRRGENGHGYASGARENIDWPFIESDSLARCLVISSAVRPNGALCQIGYDGYGVCRWLVSSRRGAEIYLLPGETVPPAACALIASLAFDCPVGIGRWHGAHASLIAKRFQCRLSSDLPLALVGRRVGALLARARRAEKATPFAGKRKYVSVRARLALFAEKEQALAPGALNKSAFGLVCRASTSE